MNNREKNCISNSITSELTAAIERYEIYLLSDVCSKNASCATENLCNQKHTDEFLGQVRGLCDLQIFILTRARD
jgi:hypothetical protein